MFVRDGSGWMLLLEIGRLYTSLTTIAVSTNVYYTGTVPVEKITTA